jgi:hypothetical protein
MIRLKKEILIVILGIIALLGIFLIIERMIINEYIKGVWDKPVSKRDIEKIREELNIIKRYLYDIWQRSHNTKDEEERNIQGLIYHNEVIGGLNNYQYKIEVMYGRPKDIYIMMKNIGKTPILGPRIVINGEKDWSTIEAILADIIEEGMTDRDKAIAIWQYVKDNMYHFNPPTLSDKLHDPVILFNVYGYGLCGDAARQVALLSKAAGMDARVWSMIDHFVAEVYYDGRWHLFDADGGVFYSLPDKTIASLEDIVKDNSLILGTPHPVEKISRHRLSEDLLMKVYARDQPKIICKDINSKKSYHRLEFFLRPNETVWLRYDNVGRYHNSIYPDEPPLYSNGQIVYPLDIKGGTYKYGIISQKNIEISDNLHLKSTAEEGYFIYRQSSPYVMVGGRVIGKFRYSKGLLKVYFSKDPLQKEWSLIWSSSEGRSKGKEVVDFSKLLNPDDDGVYEYFIKFEMEGEEVGIDELTFITDIQISTFSLPIHYQGCHKG